VGNGVLEGVFATVEAVCEPVGTKNHTAGMTCGQVGTKNHIVGTTCGQVGTKKHTVGTKYGQFGTKKHTFSTTHGLVGTRKYAGGAKKYTIRTILDPTRTIFGLVSTVSDVASMVSYPARAILDIAKTQIIRHKKAKAKHLRVLFYQILLCLKYTRYCSGTSASSAVNLILSLHQQKKVAAAPRRCETKNKKRLPPRPIYHPK
jgi:hypothetical protein